MIGLYKVKNSNNIFENTYLIDLEKQQIGNHEDADTLITALLQGDLDDLIRNNSRFSSFQTLLSESFYDILGENTFEEHIGLLYKEDVGINTIAPGVDDVNKTKKRIITYKYVNTPTPTQSSEDDG